MAEERVPWVKCVLHRYEGLDSNFQHPHKDLAVKGNICDPTAGKAEKERYLCSLANQSN